MQIYDSLESYKLCNAIIKYNFEKNVNDKLIIKVDPQFGNFFMNRDHQHG